MCSQGFALLALLGCSLLTEIPPKSTVSEGLTFSIPEQTRASHKTQRCAFAPNLLAEFLKQANLPQEKILVCLVPLFWIELLIFNLKTQQNNHKHNTVLFLTSLTPPTLQLFPKTRVVGTIAPWRGLYTPSN